MGFRICCFPKTQNHREVLLKTEYRHSPNFSSTERSNVKSKDIRAKSADARSSTSWPLDTDLYPEQYGKSPSRDTSSNKLIHIMKTSRQRSAPDKRKSTTTILMEALLGNRIVSLNPPAEKHTSTISSSYSSYAPLAMTEVLPHLYLGSYDNANNEFELRAKGITHILSLIGAQTRVHWAEVKRECVPMNDFGKTSLKDVIEKVYEFIERGQKDGNNLLVHCKIGQNRSAAVVIAFLMMSHKKSLYRAHKELKTLRPLVQINVGYAKQLLELERELFNGDNSLPADWMEPDDYDLIAGDVNYKHEHLTSSQHRLLFKQSET